jgi:hypothetical protein
MSKKPQTPRTNDGPAGNSTVADIPAGRRFTSSEEILRIEAELIADGVNLPNRAIPAEYHPEQRDYDSPEDIRAEITTEAEKEHPNRSLIGLLNEQL